ncbi:MAG TPA: DMT family transporter [Prosthecobacter sp.]
MSHTPRSILFAPALVIGSMVSLTVGASLAKGLFPILGAAGTTFVRLAIGGLVLLALWRPWRTSLARLPWRQVVLYGVVLGVMNLTFYEAIARLPIGIAIALEFLGPLSVAFFLSRGRLDVLWASMALAGVALLLPLTQVQPGLDWAGIGFALAAAVSWATYILVGQKAGASSHSGTVTAIGMTIACLTVAPFGTSAAWPVFSDLGLLPTAIAVGVLSSAIPYSLEMAALKQMDPKTFGILLSLEPALGALSAFVLLSEQISLLQCLAIACVVSASIGSTLTSRKKSQATLVSESHAP